MRELAFERERWRDLQEYVSEMNIPEQDARTMAGNILTKAGLQTRQREMDAITGLMLGLTPGSVYDFPDYREYREEEDEKSFFEKIIQTARNWLGYRADPGSGGEFLTEEEYPKVREQELRTEELLLHLGYEADPGSGGESLTKEEYEKVREQELTQEKQLLEQWRL